LGSELRERKHIEWNRKKEDDREVEGSERRKRKQA
jgi:hypothetical protein